MKGTTASLRNCGRIIWAKDESSDAFQK